MSCDWLFAQLLWYVLKLIRSYSLRGTVEPFRKLGQLPMTVGICLESKLLAATRIMLARKTNILKFEGNDGRFHITEPRQSSKGNLGELGSSAETRRASP